MEYRDILNFLHGGAANSAAVQLAGEWARAHDAAISGCCLATDPPPSIADGYAMGREGVADVMERRRSAIEADAEPLISAFRSVATACGVAADWVVPDPLEPVAELAAHSRFADLTVLGRAGLARQAAAPLSEVLAVAGFGPCVLVPVNADPAPPRRVVVAWNGSAQAKRAVEDALPLLKQALEVQLLVLGEEAEWLAACASEQMVRRLARHGVNATLRIAPRASPREADLLAAACATFHADLLVMGAYSHSHAREAVLGGATRAVLAGFPIPVLLSR